MTNIKTLRTKPVILEGMFFEGQETTEDVCKWVESHGGQVTVFAEVETIKADNGEIAQRGSKPYVLIQTENGEVSAPHGWWVLKDETNEFYVVSDTDVDEMFDEINVEEVVDAS